MTRLVSVLAAVLLVIVVFVPGAVSLSASVRLQDVASQVGLDIAAAFGRSFTGCGREDARAQARVIEALYRSAESGEAVRLA